jgi:hypothetical protein
MKHLAVKEKELVSGNMETRVMRTLNWLVTATLLLSLGASAQNAADNPPTSQPASVQTSSPATSSMQTQQANQQPTVPQAGPAPTTMDQVVDRFVLREKGLVKMLSSRTPVVETYLQNLTLDPTLGPVPQTDRYFLGRMDLSTTIDRKDYIKDDVSMQKQLLGGFSKLFKVQYQPLGFSWMIFADRNDFDRQHYDFRYIRREFLGDVRCLVFDVTPKKGTGNGRFLGRVWVEDQDYNIVRLNGTYAPRPRNSFFFHMDSWRLNLIPGYWVPAFIYSEEGDFSAGAKNQLAFKAQTRIWGYDLKKDGQSDELTNIRVDSVQDNSPTAQDASPLAAEREWQQQAEDNVIERLQRAGLLAPEGDVDKILQTVVNNIEVTNNIDLPRPVRTRVLLTSPLETFSVGNTIVISRGLVDVLPDESSLAMALSHELAHIVLGHNLGSKYAFNDRMLFSDEATYQNLGFKHIPEEEAAADKKAIDLLKNSPYAQKLDGAGLFLKALNTRAAALNALLTAHLGNNMGEAGVVTRMTTLMNSAPNIDWNKLDQIAALPLGGRIKLNAWDDKVELVKSQPVAITSARDKMPFEVTPFFPRLQRTGTTDTSNTTGNAANTAPNAATTAGNTNSAN